MLRSTVSPSIVRLRKRALIRIVGPYHKTKMSVEDNDSVVSQDPSLLNKNAIVHILTFTLILSRFISDVAWSVVDGGLSESDVPWGELGLEPVSVKVFIIQSISQTSPSCLFAFGMNSPSRVLATAVRTSKPSRQPSDSWRRSMSVANAGVPPAEEKNVILLRSVPNKD